MVGRCSKVVSSFPSQGPRYSNTFFLFFRLHNVTPRRRHCLPPDLLFPLILARLSLQSPSPPLSSCPRYFYWSNAPVKAPFA